MKKTKNSNSYKRATIIGFISSFLILIAINILSSFLFLRVDLTEDKRHSLSPATIKLLKELDEKVYIRVYLKGEDFPADYQLFAKSTEDLLQEFRNYSNQIFFEFIDPVKGKTKDEANSIYGELAKKGLSPIPISKESSTGYSTQYVIPGALVTYNNKEYPVNLVVSDPSGNEYWLTYSTQELEYNIIATIRNLMRKSKPKVAFLEGHGELSLLNTSWVTYQLQRFYSVERIKLEGKINSLRNISIEDSVTQTLKIGGNKYDVLVIAQPSQPFSDYDKYIIDQHIMRGGKALWLIDATTASMDSLQNSIDFFASPHNLHLNDLFFKYGVRLNANLLQDLSCQSIPVSDGMIGGQQQFKYMTFPYALNVVNFSTHPIVRNMKKIKSDFAGSIDFVGKSDLMKTVLMTSSERTKMVPTPSIVSLQAAIAKPNMQEFAFQRLPLAVLVEGVFESAFNGLLPIEFDTIKEFGFVAHSPETRQIFVSDGDIIRNFVDPKKGQPFPAGYDRFTGIMYDNSEFIINCINYLCADDDLLQIRAKNFKIGSLNKTKLQGKSTFYAVLNIAVPLVIVLIMGIIMNLLKRMKYRKRGK